MTTAERDPRIEAAARAMFVACNHSPIAGEIWDNVSQSGASGTDHYLMLARAAVAALDAAASPASVTEWQPISTAPKDGSHFLAYRMPIGIRFTNNTNPPTVVHWFDDPELPGFYTSVNELAPERPFEATHWQPLPAPPAIIRGER